MRQAGVIVDDVAKHHRKDENTLGTQAMHFPEKGEKIDFHLKAALFTFELQKPTMEEHLNWPEEDIIDIAVEDWNPQKHTDDIHSANDTPETNSDLIQVN